MINVMFVVDTLVRSAHNVVYKLANVSLDKRQKKKGDIILMKRFVIGDIHGRIEALKQVLSRSKFNYKKDKLIVLGDIADGGYNTYEVVEELLKIKNLIFILGNHDEWFINHIKTGWAEDIWLTQGGENTIKSYKQFNMNIPVTHQDFFNKAIFYYIEDNMLFVHGGYDPHKPMSAQDKAYLLWDRTIIERFINGLKCEFKKVFIGHTTTQSYGFTKPMPIISSNGSTLWLMDTGAGWNGLLTIMDIDTEKYWQSDIQKPAVR
jgi:serine/threonine protein phosphatase 1